MSRYDDVLEFLAKHEDKREEKMNRRTRLSADEATSMRRQYPGLPDDYLDYLTDIGWGAFRECQYMIYGGLIDPADIFGDERATSLGKQLLCFGDNFSGECGAFMPEENWRVVEIWHDSMEICETNSSFEDFVRDQMLMADDGTDLRSN